MAVKKNLIIVQELVKEFKDMNDSFLAPITSHDDKVNADTINFNTIGAAPDVLVDNTSYPIATAGRTDDSVVVSLKKLDTTNTSITDDELFALTYDKKSSVRKQHLEALMIAHIKLGAFSLAPTSHSANAPVLATTGATTGVRKRLKMEDIIRYKALVDALEIPLEGRNLVLSPEHIEDILLIDQSFRDRYNSTETGKIIKQIYGFNIWESLHTPKYVGTTLAKKAWGAAAAASDIPSSVFYSTVNVMKAKGSTSMYYRDASMDPENRKSVVGFRMYDIVHPVSAKGFGSIISDYVAP